MGVRQGVITTAVNHLGNHIKQEYNKSLLRKQVEKAYKNSANSPTEMSVSYIKTMIEKISLLRKAGGNGLLVATYEILNESGLGVDGSLTYAYTGADYKIRFYNEAFSSNLTLAGVIGHELIHVNDHLTGTIRYYESAYGSNSRGGNEIWFSHYMSEVNAYRWSWQNAFDIHPFHNAYYQAITEYNDANYYWKFSPAAQTGKNMPYIQLPNINPNLHY